MSGSALAVQNQGDTSIIQRLWSREQIEEVKLQIARGWKQPMTDDELSTIAVICERTRLDPLAKPQQIYFIKRWDGKLQREVMTAQTGIDGLRLIAQRSRQYSHQVGPQWCGADGIWKDVWLSNDPPAAARVGVVRRGSSEPTWGVATWREWAQWDNIYEGSGQNRKATGRKLAPFWEKMPAHMLSKTAEGMAIKRALPHETNDLEIAHNEELQRLEVTALASRYAEIHGADEDSSLPALPYGAGAPNYEALPAGTFVEDTEVEENQAPESAPAAQQKDGPSRGDLLEGYGALLSTASTEGAVARPDLHKWIIPTGSSDEEIIALGRRLRAAIDTFRKNNKQGGPAEPMPQSAAIPPAVKMVKVGSALSNRLATAIEDAARIEVDFDDCKVALPAPEEQVLRACEKLEERIKDKQNRLAGVGPAPSPAFDQAELEPLPFDND